jgi:alpha-D-ribose 1-methylphosphonate 5-triphosphate diphosphatase PhnM
VLGSDHVKKTKDTVTQDQLDLMIVKTMDKRVRAQQQFTVEEIHRYVLDLCHKRGIVFAKLADGSTELITNRSYMETSIQNAIDLLCEAGLLEGATS